MERLTAELVDFVVDTKFDDLPETVVHKVKQILLDTIGCGLAGYVVDRGKIAVELVKDLAGQPQATVIGGDKTSCTLAAFANGELMVALDYEPGGPLTPHVCPFIIPSALACAERVNGSGKDLITAIAIGIEVGGRVGSSLAQKSRGGEGTPRHEHAYGFTIFGGVAGAGKLLGLSREKMANAFGIAGASTPVTATTKWRQTPRPAIMNKFNTWSGWISQLATMAALAAEKGFTGDTTILDGEWGFWKTYGPPFSKPDSITSDLGRVWNVGKVRFKNYPTCGLNHSGIDAINKIILENEIEPEDIESILVLGDPYLLAPIRAGVEVKSFADTQFCNAYIFAVAAYHGRQPGPEWQLPSIYEDQKIRDLMKKVKVGIHPKVTELQESAFKAVGIRSVTDVVVELTAKGRKFVRQLPSSRNAITDEDLKKKFRNNCSFSRLNGGNAENLINVIDNLEVNGDAKRLASLFGVKRAA